SEFLDHNLAFKDALASLFLSSTFLFVGCSFDGIQGYLGAARISPSSVRHYAVIDVSNEPLWKTRGEVLKLRYGITVIPFDRRRGEHLLGSAIEGLRDLANASDFVGRHTVSGPSDERALKRLVLKNIGALGSCELEFKSNWTVLIGPNGVGKSTVLRAIA